MAYFTGHRLSAIAMSLILTGMLSFCAAQNVAPEIEAGPNDTTRLGLEFRFVATVSDTDSLVYKAPKLNWTQISGPDGGAEILAPTARRSQVEFSLVGTYEFQLAANDSEFVVYDTVKVQVDDSISFKILEPKAGDCIDIGTTYKISWQLDPESENLDVLVEYAPDGIEYIVDTPNRIDSATWDWVLSDTLQPTDACLIKVRKYFETGVQAIVGPIILAADCSQAVQPARHISIPLSPRDSRCDLFTLDGRRLNASAAKSRLSKPGSSLKGIVIRRAYDEKKSVRPALMP